MQQFVGLSAFPNAWICGGAVFGSPRLLGDSVMLAVPTGMWLHGVNGCMRGAVFGSPRVPGDNVMLAVPSRITCGCMGLN